MNLPKLNKPQRYGGLYILDFGTHCGVGFTAQEVAELLESEAYRQTRVYKIHRAYPNGRLELKAVLANVFQMEAGMFFYSADEQHARRDFEALINMAAGSNTPCRAKVHLARYREDKYVVALIYPAEYDEEVSRWLLKGRYRTIGAVEAGTSAVQRYYDAGPEILKKHQLWPNYEFENRSGRELLRGLTKMVQR